MCPELSTLPRDLGIIADIGKHNRDRVVFFKVDVRFLALALLVVVDVVHRSIVLY